MSSFLPPLNDKIHERDKGGMETRDSRAVIQTGFLSYQVESLGDLPAESVFLSLEAWVPTSLWLSVKQ